MECSILIRAEPSKVQPLNQGKKKNNHNNHMFRSLSYQSHPIKPQEFPGKAIAAQLHLLPGGCITRRVQTQIFLHLENHQGVAWMFVGVSLNGGTPKSSILIGFSIINHSILGVPLFLETPRKLVPLMICSVFSKGLGPKQSWRTSSSRPVLYATWFVALTFVSAKAKG